MTALARPGLEARRAKGWLGAHKWLLARRVSQVVVIALFLSGPWFGVWILKGSLASSLFLDTVPLADPFVLLQSLVAGHALAATALIGAAVVVALYGLVGGRAYCAWVCPVNPVTDLAHWLAERFALPKGWALKRTARLWLAAGALAASAATGTVAWEFVNPVTAASRGLIFGFGYGWLLVAAAFAFDLFVSRRGWCGHLCPVGAAYGLLGAASLVRVSAPARAKCNDCMDCYAVCPEPHVITPALKNMAARPVVLSGDCTNCGRCIDVCSKDVYRFGWRFETFAATGLKCSGLAAVR